MKKVFFILMFMVDYLSMSAQKKTEGVTGEYYLQGVMETASGFKLMPDSTFQFFFTYGALDRFGTGKWKMKNDSTIIFESKKRPDADFRIVDSKTVGFGKFIMKITEENEHLLQHVSFVIYSKKEGRIERNADAEGIAMFDANDVDSMGLIFEFCPDRYSIFPVKDKSKNYYEFRFEPWIFEVFFHNYQLRYKGTALRGKHPLLDNKEYWFAKGE